MNEVTDLCFSLAFRSPRSGSSGSPGISGSPRAGRRADRREPVQQPQPFPSSEEHESYVDYLSKST